MYVYCVIHIFDIPTPQGKMATATLPECTEEKVGGWRIRLGRGKRAGSGKGEGYCFCTFYDMFEGNGVTNNIATAKQIDWEQLKVVTRLAWLNILNGKNGRDPQFDRY